LTQLDVALLCGNSCGETFVIIPIFLYLRMLVNEPVEASP